MNPFTEDVSPTRLRLRENKLEETEYLLLILMVRTTFPLCSAYIKERASFGVMQSP